MHETINTQSFAKVFKLIPSLILIYGLLLFIEIDNNYSEISVFGHSFFGNNSNTLNATQSQQNENYVVDLYMNPSKPLADKVVNFTIEIKSKAGDVLIELPVASYILKDGKPVFSNPNNYTLVQQQHYDFDHMFNESGTYSLVIDVKDIFYTLQMASFNFEIVVEGSISDKIIKLIGSYYYLLLPIIIIIGISVLVNIRRERKDRRN